MSEPPASAGGSILSSSPTVRKSVDRFFSPEGCQIVAGGRSVAKTTGRTTKFNPHLEQVLENCGTSPESAWKFFLCASSVMFDQRGSGRSEVVTDPKLLTIDYQVRDLEAFRQQYDKDTDFVLISPIGSKKVEDEILERLVV